MFTFEMLLASLFCMLPYGIFWGVMLWKRTAEKIYGPPIVNNLTPVVRKEVFRKIFLISLFVGPAILIFTCLLASYIARAELSPYMEAIVITFLLFSIIAGVIFNLLSKQIKK